MMISKHPRRASGILAISSDSKLTGGARVVFALALAVVIPIHHLPLFLRINLNDTCVYCLAFEVT
jgi:hypothetical protein